MKTADSETIGYRCSPAEKSQLQTIAEQNGISMSEIVRASVEVGLPIILRDGIKKTLVKGPAPITKLPEPAKKARKGSGAALLSKAKKVISDDVAKSAHETVSRR